MNKARKIYTDKLKDPLFFFLSKINVKVLTNNIHQSPRKLEIKIMYAVPPKHFRGGGSKQVN